MMPACPTVSGNAAEMVRGKEFLPGITFLTGFDLKPFQTRFCRPELPDPYATILKDSVVISGTAGYYLKFSSVEDIARGGPYEVVPLSGDLHVNQSWDMKPVPWSASAFASSAPSPRLWDPVKDTQAPRVIWYGGHMRSSLDGKTTRWPEDNYSRDVFAFLENAKNQWFSLGESVFSLLLSWPRPFGNFLGHRYGHQIVMTPKKQQDLTLQIPMIFYEEVTTVRADGSPALTQLFADEMITPFEARKNPTLLLSPIDPNTGRPYRSAVREDGSVLIEGPLYFRFLFEGEPWEAIGFSAGSYYGRYSASFASRSVADGLQGRSFQIDLTDDGTDIHDAGTELGKTLNLAGGPGRPAVIVAPDGNAILNSQGGLQLLLHGYRKEILPDNDYTVFPTNYRLDQMFRVAIHASLKVEKRPNNALRFRIIGSELAR